MNKNLVLFLTIVWFLLPWFTLPVSAKAQDASARNQQQDYSDHAATYQRLQELNNAYPAYTHLQSLARTEGGKDILLLTLGTGDISNKPAIAIVGGVVGTHLLGSEITVQMAEKILAKTDRPEIRNMLDSVSFYFFPDMSPDAREQYFRPLRYERLGNANPTDLDRDGRTGEDGYDDLNGDGLITMMRVKDPTGAWMPHPDDERVMVKARPEKGEQGMYHLFSEGIDNDQDGEFNEDGEEGVFFNRNFSFGYPAFSRGAGHHAISETESRAIADFLFEAKNVFAVWSLGEANNLTQPLAYDERKANKRIPTGWKEQDIAVNKRVSHLYNQHLGEDAPPKAAGGDGDFFQWAYFHYGRYSFSTQAWSVPTPENDEGDAFESDELNFLRWADENGLTDVFVPWTAVEHPDFPGREVEVGGIKPFVMQNPPYAMVDETAQKHTEFLVDLAGLRPTTDVINLKTESLGRNLHRVTADVVNKGVFPTVSAMGERLRWMQKTVIRATVDEGQSLVSGKTVEVLGAIDGRSAEQRSWLVQGRGTFKLHVGAEASGFTTITVDL